MASRHAKSKKKNKKATVIITGIALAVITTVTVLIIAQCHNGTGDKLKEVSYPPHRRYKSRTQWEPVGFFSECLCNATQFDLMLGDHYQYMRGEEGAYSHDALFDPAVNIDYGCYILREHLDTFENEECAVAAYNAGAGSVSSWLNDPNISSDGKTLIVDNIPYDETRDYVHKVEDAKQVYLDLYY